MTKHEDTATLSGIGSSDGLAPRSSLAVVRNPLLALPSAQVLRSLPPEARNAFRSLLLDIRKDAQVRAEKCWRQHKAPMAAYWKAVAVYAGHTARLLRGANDANEPRR